MEFLAQMVQSALAGAGSMETRYLSMITLLDQAETLSGSAVKDDNMSPDLSVQIAEAKQAVIDDFARANDELTLASIRKRANEAALTD